MRNKGVDMQNKLIYKSGDDMNDLEKHTLVVFKWKLKHPLLVHNNFRAKIAYFSHGHYMYNYYRNEASTILCLNSTKKNMLMTCHKWN